MFDPRRLLTILLLMILAASPVLAQGKKGKKKAKSPVPVGSEDDYYKLLKYEIPKDVVLECGGLEFMPDGRLAVSSRRGEIWMLQDALNMDPSKAKWSRYAHGLHEVLGLAAKGDWLYVTQRCDLSRIKDTDKDGKADLFEVVNDGWEINGDYHEYAFGSRFDKEGNLWVVLCLTGSFNSNNPFRGWCVRITPEGKLLPTCSGVRSPGGIGFNAEGDVFYTDNQGPWNGTCGLKHLLPGGFVGHPGGNRWWAKYAKGILPEPPEPKSGSRLVVEAKKHPLLVLPPVLFPYQKMGQSAAGLDCDLSGGKFGPFEKQLFVGDQTHSTIMRVFLEKVGDRYQGVVFPFRQGLSCGVVPTRFAPDGSLFIGETNRGWGSRGGKPFGLERLVWTGKVPFEVQEMRAKHQGFELVFTKPVDPKTAADPASYKFVTYCYIYQSNYGSPEVDHTNPTVTKVEVGKDNRSVRLWLSATQEGHVHEMHANGVRSADGEPLLHPQAYYTLNYPPKGD